MKKSKLSIGLVTSFIATIGLAGCNELTKSKDALVTFTDYNGKEVEVINDEFYEKYRKTTNGISKFYDQILETLIRNEFNKADSKIKTKRDYNTIVYEAKNQVKENKDTAKSNASSNGTSYETEWENILESNGCENEKELLEHFIYQMEKSDIEDWYFDNAELGTLTEQFVGFDNAGAAVNSGNIASVYPYHVKHILVKVDDGSNYYSGTVTEAQARRLYNVVDMLRDGNLSFGDIAQLLSEDGSASKGGEFGIMSAQLSGSSLPCVSEFQLGLYAYDTMLSGRANSDALTTLKTDLGISGQYKESGKSIEEYYKDNFGLKEVPASVFDDLSEYADVITDKDGQALSNNNSIVYPRNVLWNLYLNHHDVFVISNVNRAAMEYTGAAAIAANATKASLGSGNIDKVGTTYAAVETAADGKCGFRPVADLDANAEHKYLTDEKGRVIVGVRSEYGIHFMVIQKSVLDANIVDYYTTDIEKAKESDTYISFITSETKSDYTSRKTDVENAIKGFDSTYSYRLYEYLKTENQIEFHGKGEGINVLDQVNSYIENLKDDNTYNREKNLNNIWETYLELLEAQYANRIADRLVPEGVVKGFNFGGEAFDKGGVCYYA